MRRNDSGEVTCVLEPHRDLRVRLEALRGRHERDQNRGGPEKSLERIEEFLPCIDNINCKVCKDLTYLQFQ